MPTVNDVIVLWNAGREQLSFKRAFLTSDKKKIKDPRISQPAPLKPFFLSKISRLIRG